MPSYYPAPPQYREPMQYDGGNRIADLILQGGDIAAQGAMNTGRIWSGAFAGIGQQLDQYAERKAVEKKQQEETQRKRAAVQEMAVRDAAWLKYVEGGTWQNNPQEAYVRSRQVWGPQESGAQFQALTALGKMMHTDPEKMDPKDATKNLALVGRGLMPMGDAAWERAWPTLTALAEPVAPGYLPKQFSTEARQQLEPIIQGILDQDKKPEAKHKVKVPGPDGQPMEKLFTESEMAAGVKTYVEPKAASAPKDSGADNRIWVNRNGQVVRIREDQYQPGDTPMSTKEQGRAVTSGDAGRITEFDTSLDDLATLRGTLTGPGGTGTASRVGAALPNVVTEVFGVGAESKKTQATIDRVKQVIGKALEGGVLRKEDEAKYAKILPTIGDPPEVVEAKLDGLERAIAQRRERHLESLSDAGYDVSKFNARTGGPAKPASKADYDKLPSGTVFEAPDGTMRVKP